MAQIISSQITDWENYHSTVALQVGKHLSLEGSQAPMMDAAAYLTDLRTAIQNLVADAITDGANICPIGASWSFSPIVEPSHWLLHTLKQPAGTDAAWPAGRIGAGRIYPVDQAHLHANCSIPAGRLVLTGGGVGIDALNDWLDNHGLSLRTSGASNGQSIAGAIATGVHGSVPSEGGIQNHVRGIFLVTGPNESVWIERNDTPALSDATALGFAQRVVRDDDAFDAAVVHLGAMGYVCGVLLEVADAYLLEIVQTKKRIGRAAILELQAGNFRAFSKRLGIDRDPYFVQIILNPFFPFRIEDPVETKDFLDPSIFGLPALHRLFYEPRVGANPVQSGLPPDVAGEPLNMISAFLEAMSKVGIPLRNSAVVSLMMYQLGLFNDIPAPGKPPVFMRWSQTTPPHVNQGDLFSRSFAFRRADLLRVLRIVLPEFRENEGGPVVCTLRFVAESAGTLAFTPFDHNVVLDFDGVRTRDSFKAVDRVRAALLNEVGLPFREHMGKMATIDTARILREFGDPNVAGTASARWRAQRDLLLPAIAEPVFGSQVLRNAGLI